MKIRDIGEGKVALLEGLLLEQYKPNNCIINNFISQILVKIKILEKSKPKVFYDVYQNDDIWSDLQIYQDLNFMCYFLFCWLSDFCGSFSLLVMLMT